MKSKDIVIRIEPTVPLLQESIAHFESNLSRWVTEEILPTGTTYSSFCEEIERKIGRRELNEAVVDDFYMRTLINNEFKLNLDIAVYHLLRAKRYANVGQHDAYAWSALNEAIWFSAELRVALVSKDAEQKAREQHKLNAGKASKGGRARNDAYSPTRSHTASLLRGKKPAGGWASKEEAIKAVSGEVLEFVRHHRVSLSEGNLSRVLSDWIGIPEVASAFLESKA